MKNSLTLPRCGLVAVAASLTISVPAMAQDPYAEPMQAEPNGAHDEGAEGDSWTPTETDSPAANGAESEPSSSAGTSSTAEREPVAPVSTHVAGSGSALNQPPSVDPQRDAGGLDRRSHEATLERRLLHGFRLGAMYVMRHDVPIDPLDETSSLKARHGMRSPYQFLIGYELTARLIGHDWLNVLIVANAMAAGLEQSKFFPSANALIGFEFEESFQAGVGVNLTPERDKAAHMIVAGGWTPKAGSFYVPVHGFFIPDIDGNHRIGMTVGVNW